MSYTKHTIPNLAPDEVGYQHTESATLWAVSIARGIGADTYMFALYGKARHVDAQGAQINEATGAPLTAETHVSIDKSAFFDGTETGGASKKKCLDNLINAVAPAAYAAEQAYAALGL